jgi:hypothetical protein
VTPVGATSPVEGVALLCIPWAKVGPSWTCDGGVLDVTPFLKASCLSSSWPQCCLRLMLSLPNVWIAGGGGVCNVKSKLSR